MTGEEEELLSAYIDGALSAAEAERVEARLANDTGFARDLERLRHNDRLLSGAIRDLVPDEADEASLRRFGLAPASDRAEAPPEPGRRAVNDNARRWVWPAAGAAIAASAALVLLGQPRGSQDPLQSVAFSAALDSSASLQSAALPNGSRLSPRLTVIAGDGRYCREFEISGAQAETAREGIACRSASGRWQVMTLTAGGPKLPDSGRIEVAQGPDSQALDRAYARLKASDPLPPSEEQRLIRDHWQSR